MAMMKLFVFVLCVLLNITRSQEQTASCVPQEIPASSLNCSVVESAYLSCACNVYKTSILELMSSITCLLPTSSVAGEVQDQVFQLLDMVTVPTTIIESIEGQLPSIPAASLVDTSSESSLGMINLIMNISQKLGEDVFNRLCANVGQLSQCVNSDFLTSNKPEDVTLKALFNLDNVDTFLTSMCAMKSELFGQKNCLSEALLPIGICAYLPSLWSIDGTPTFPLFTGTAISQTQFHQYCPIAGDFARCVEIQMAKCSPNFAAMIATLPSQLLTTPCNSLAMTGTDYLTTSSLLVCGIRHVTKAIPIVAMIESISEGPSTVEIQSIIESILNLACEILPDYFMCVMEELPSSRSMLDIFIRELIDVKQITYGNAITDLICEPERIKAITAMVPCVLTKANDLEACATPNNIMVFENFNISNLGHDANKDRQQFCGPLRDLTMCIFDAMLVPCDAQVAEFAKETYHWIMQTECNGARNGTFQQIIDKQTSGNPVVVGNARIYWLAVLLVSIIIHWV
ncbi:uncharacterized protein LOC117325824 [Pecten maximus]|uniref:uncharacterized protein LOC117325824 n=1 Tax=Pecten maximus TaxID=6579 RepID=UPI0014589F16|nr:uncharacterized protein LOC117325824 [Pecten maximus]